MKNLLIGAHCSIAGGVHNALLEGKRIGATTIQLFTANQRQWKIRKFLPEEIALWQKTLQETGLQKIMSHDSYLINLGAPDSENLSKSRAAFAAEIERCITLGISYLNFHPGASCGKEAHECLDLIVESLLNFAPLLEGQSLRILLENTAGQGSSVGWRFEELAYIISRVEGKIPIGVCLDTCHLFAAGYDVRTKEAWDQTLKEFDKVVGLKNLYAFHVNDSMKGLGTRVDRHQDLGKGLIGPDSFKVLMSDPRTKNLPKYLETPTGPTVWVEEIALLRTLAE